MLGNREPTVFVYASNLKEEVCGWTSTILLLFSNTTIHTCDLAHWMHCCNTHFRLHNLSRWQET